MDNNNTINTSPVTGAPKPPGHAIDPVDIPSSDLPAAAPAVSSTWLSWMRWVPSSANHLAEAEQRIFSHLSTPHEGKFIEIQDPTTDKPQKKVYIWTITMSTNSNTNNKPPLVLVHGFAGGVGLWCVNLDALARESRVYAFDVLGFGQSSRPIFSSDPLQTEAQWADSIESWRKAMGIRKMVLLGHSLGGYLSAAYALRHPDSIAHLILVDPWGFPERPVDAPGLPVRIPFWLRTAAAVMRPFNPLATIRMAGPWGPQLVNRFRPDLQHKFAGLVRDEGAIHSYIYHCNAQYPSGETAFKNMTLPYGWSKNPMSVQIKSLRADIPLTYVYGENSWISSRPAFDLREARPSAYVGIHKVRNSGHHVYADRADDFNDYISKLMHAIGTGETPSLK